MFLTRWLRHRPSQADVLAKAAALEQQAVIQYLQNIPYEQLVAVLQKVFEERRPNPEEDEYHRNKFFLAIASSWLKDYSETEWEPWEIQAVAYPNRDVFREGFGPPGGCYQWGTCQTCNIVMRSNEKNGICPICGNEVYMT